MMKRLPTERDVAKEACPSWAWLGLAILFVSTALVVAGVGAFLARVWKG